MNNKTGGNRGLRRAGALAAMAPVAVLAAACGGSASPSQSAPTYVQVLALAKCMRSHGVPNFPDPDASGGYSLTANGSLTGAGGRQSTSTAARDRRLTAIAGIWCLAARLSHSWSRTSSRSSNSRPRCSL